MLDFSDIHAVLIWLNPTKISSVYRLDQYIPDALYESYETLRDNILVWLIRFGLIGKASTVKVDSSVSDTPRE